jgi:hypothetical protein
MLAIYKYPLKVADLNEIEMPAGAVPVCVQMQYDRPCLWAMVDPAAPTMARRRFRIVGTGHLFDEVDAKYVNTFQMHDGGLVFHVFDLGEVQQ